MINWVSINIGENTVFSMLLCNKLYSKSCKRWCQCRCYPGTRSGAWDAIKIIARKVGEPLYYEGKFLGGRKSDSEIPGVIIKTLHLSENILDKTLRVVGNFLRLSENILYKLLIAVENHFGMIMLIACVMIYIYIET